MCVCALRQRLTPGPAASYKVPVLSGTIKAPCGQPSLFLPLNLQRSLQNHLTASSVNRPPTGLKWGHTFQHTHSEEQNALTVTYLNHKHTHTHPQVSQTLHRQISFFPYWVSHSRGRQRVVALCVCVLNTVWGSVEPAYLAQNQQWDDLLTVSAVRVKRKRERESLCPPGRGQAGILSQQPQTPRVKFI